MKADVVLYPSQVLSISLVPESKEESDFLELTSKKMIRRELDTSLLASVYISNDVEKITFCLARKK